MRAIVYDAVGAPLELRDVAPPECPPDGAVVDVRATGVCRSDWHAWRGHDPVALPHVPGHEFAGVIAAVGPAVTAFAVGDRVTAPFVNGCGRCAFCRAGNAQICPDQTQPGFTHPGSFADQVAVRAADLNLVRLPAEIDFVSAAALGCRFATAFRALTGHGPVGGTIAVFGCGGVGLSAVMIAVALGARVLAVDPSPAALALAASLGAIAVPMASSSPAAGAVSASPAGGVCVSPVAGAVSASPAGGVCVSPVAGAVSASPAGGVCVSPAAEAVSGSTAGAFSCLPVGAGSAGAGPAGGGVLADAAALVEVADVAIDAYGSAATAEASVRSLRRGGRHVQVGLMLGDDARAPLPWDLVVARELHVVGSHGMAAADYPRMLAMVAAGELAPRRLVGSVIPLAEAGAALMAMDAPVAGQAGIVVAADNP